MSGTIVVDGVFFQIDVITGIARLWREILGQWAQCDLAPRIVVLNRGRLPDGLKGLATHDCPPLDMHRWEDDLPVVQRLCDELGAVLFVSTYYTQPETTPSVLWVHDMIPERAGYDLAQPVWRQKHAAIHRASAYACSSTNSLKDLHELFPGTKTKPAVVAGCGVSATMRPVAAQELQRFREDFVQRKLEGRSYIFMPGSTGAYKNGALLYEALSRMDCSNLALLLTFSSPDVDLFRSIPGLVVHCEHLNDADLRLAYGAAHCLVYPSFYEGFGLPVAEAMACGCPVICSNGSSLPEVAGDAALLIDPRFPDQLVAALNQIGHTDARKSLIARGLIQAGQWTWFGAATQLEVLISQVLNEPGWWSEET